LSRHVSVSAPMALGTKRRADKGQARSRRRRPLHIYSPTGRPKIGSDPHDDARERYGDVPGEMGDGDDGGGGSATEAATPS